MVSASFNYSPYAVVDDGSCIIGGCIDSRHPAFDATASYDDGSCPYLIEGCLDRAAANYRPAAVLPKVSDCKYNIAGCTNSRFLGFDPTATVMNVEYCGVAVREGCTDSRATSYRNDANTHLAAACAFFGCTDSSRPNYDATATREDGSCGRVYTGCMDSAATNYRSIATVPDYCAHPGCMDPTSYVYDAGATYNDGSCYTYVSCLLPNTSLRLTQTLIALTLTLALILTLALTRCWAVPTPSRKTTGQAPTSVPIAVRGRHPADWPLALPLTPALPLLLTLTLATNPDPDPRPNPRQATLAAACAASVAETSRHLDSVTTRARPHPPHSPRHPPRRHPPRHPPTHRGGCVGRAS